MVTVTLVLICVVGVGYYYKEDVQGFTKYEVREARSALLEYYRLINEENGNARQFIIHNISYKPDSIQYYYAEKHVMKNGMNPDDCIYLQGDVTYSIWYTNGEYIEEFLPKYGFTLVLSENDEWQLYGSGY